MDDARDNAALVNAWMLWNADLPSFAAFGVIGALARLFKAGIVLRFLDGLLFGMVYLQWEAVQETR